MLTPSDPTTALAALIAGNQRHVDRRANGRSATVSTRIPPASAKPFALSIELERMREPLTDLFDVSVDQVHSFVLSPGSGDMRSGRFEVMVSSEEDLVRIVDGSVEALGFSLVVVLGGLRSTSPRSTSPSAARRTAASEWLASCSSRTARSRRRSRRGASAWWARSWTSAMGACTGSGSTPTRRRCSARASRLPAPCRPRTQP